MKLRVTFIVDANDWGPINGYLLDKVEKLEVTNAVPIKTAAVNTHGGSRSEGMKRTSVLMSLIRQSKNKGVKFETIYDRYEKEGGTRSAAYQALTRLVDKGLVSTSKDGKAYPTSKGMTS